MLSINGKTKTFLKDSMATSITHDPLSYAPQNTGNAVQLSELDLFSTVALQESISDCEYERVYPVDGSLDDSQPEITFNVLASDHATSLCDR